MPPEFNCLWDNDLSLIQNIGKDKLNHSIILRHKGIFGLLVLACLHDLAVTEEEKIKKQIAIAGRMSKMAVTSLVLGILSIFTMFFTAVPGLILGIIALIRIKKNPQKFRGARVAVWGIVLSAMFTVCLLALFFG